MSSKILTFVTGNSRKIEEVRQILKGLDGTFPYTLCSKAIDLPELQGECDDIAKAKCKLAAQIVGGPVIVEDTSLHFLKLGGLPGPYIKWFLKSVGHKGLNDMLCAYKVRPVCSIPTTFKFVLIDPYSVSLCTG